MDPTTQRILLGSSSSGESYWIAQFSNASSFTRTPRRVLTDSNQNVYVYGWVGGGPIGAWDFYLIKYNSAGNLIFQKAYGSAGNDFGYGAAIDSSNNIYCCGSSFSQDNYLLKTDSTGFVNWYYTPAASSYPSYGTVSLDSSQNPIICAYFYDGSNSAFFVQKYNPSGTVLWTKSITKYSINSNFQHLSCTSGGNTVLLGQWPDPSIPSTLPGIVIGLLNSSGTVTSSRAIYRSAYNLTIGTLNALSTDTSSNIAIAAEGENPGLGSTLSVFIKLDTSYNIAFSRSLSFGANNVNAYSSTIDSLGNTYFAGYWYSGITNNTYIVKYNSSGVLQWQRSISYSGQSCYPNALTTDSKNNLYVAIHVPGVGIVGTFKLPSDGSKTGTYGNWTYQNLSLTESSISVSAISAGLYDQTPSYTTYGNAFSSTNLTDSSTTIPL